MGRSNPQCLLQDATFQFPDYIISFWAGFALQSCGSLSRFPGMAGLASTGQAWRSSKAQRHSLQDTVMIPLQSCRCSMDASCMFGHGFSEMQTGGCQNVKRWPRRRCPVLASSSSSSSLQARRDTKKALTNTNRVRRIRTRA